MELTDFAGAMTPRQVFTVMGLGLGLTLLVLQCIRKRWLRERYAMVWVFIAVAMLTVPVLYPVYEMLAGALGITNVTSLFFFLAIVGICLLCLQFSLALSTAYGQRKRVTQELALVKERLARLEAESGRRDDEEPS